MATSNTSKDLGKIAVTQGGTYDPNTTYEKLTSILYNGSTYTTLKTVKGVTPTNDGVNYQLTAQGQEKKIATATETGVIKGSDDINIGEDGALSINTQFQQAAELANIIAGEAIQSVLGKVSKAVATTMNLDQEALLKNMLSNQDVDDANKIPTSAYIHTLAERIGMGETLTSGDNLTSAVDQLNSNFNNFADIELKSATVNVLDGDTILTTATAQVRRIGKLLICQVVVNGAITISTICKIRGDIFAGFDTSYVPIFSGFCVVRYSGSTHSLNAIQLVLTEQAIALRGSSATDKDNPKFSTDASGGLFFYYFAYAS